MKTSISTDDYLAALGIMHLLIEAKEKVDKYGDALERMFEVVDDNEPDIWECIYFKQDITAAAALGDWLKDNNIQVTGKEHD